MLDFNITIYLVTTIKHSVAVSFEATLLILIAISTYTH